MIRAAHDRIVTYEFASLRAQAGLAHGVFARHGGVSPHPWHSLNLSTSTGDTLDNVSENYRRVYAALDFTPHDAVTTRQVHGNGVAVVGREQRGQRVDDCDALVTNAREVVLLQRHADCPPIFLYDPQHQAIGVAHAGWRGTLANIAAEMVRALGEAYGSQPARLIAAVGPAIGVCCYTVGTEVQRAFEARYASAREWFQPREQQLYLDLSEAIRAQLHAAGVRQIELAQVCTACCVSDFYSARAEQRRNGCFGAVIALRA